MLVLKRYQSVIELGGKEKEVKLNFLINLISLVLLHELKRKGKVINCIFYRILLIYYTALLYLLTYVTNFEARFCISVF